MIRRSTSGWIDGIYSLPANGLEFGETLSGAAARETQEEVGISTKMLTLSPSMYVWM